MAIVYKYINMDPGLIFGGVSSLLIIISIVTLIIAYYSSTDFKSWIDTNILSKSADTKPKSDTNSSTDMTKPEDNSALTPPTNTSSTQPPTNDMTSTQPPSPTPSPSPTPAPTPSPTPSPTPTPTPSPAPVPDLLPPRGITNKGILTKGMAAGITNVLIRDAATNAPNVGRITKNTDGTYSDGIYFDNADRLIDVPTGKCWSIDGTIFKLTDIPASGPDTCAKFIRTPTGQFKSGDKCISADVSRDSTGNLNNKIVNAVDCTAATLPNSAIFDFITMSDWTQNAGAPRDYANSNVRYIIMAETNGTKYPDRYGLSDDKSGSLKYTNANGTPFILRDGVLISLTDMNTERCISVNESSTPSPTLISLPLSGTDATYNNANYTECNKYYFNITNDGIITIARRSASTVPVWVVRPTVSHSGTVTLNDNSTVTRMLPNNSTPAQLITLAEHQSNITGEDQYMQKVKHTTIGAGLNYNDSGYVQYNTSDKQYCLHPSGGSPFPVDNTPAVIHTCTTHPRIRIKHEQDSGYLRHMISGKCLAPIGGANNIYDGVGLVYMNKCDQMSKFNKLDNGNLQHDATKMCIKPSGGLNSPIVLTKQCDGGNFFYTSQPASLSQ